MKVKQASRLNSVKEYYFSKKLKEIADLRAEGKDIINLGIGNPDLPPSEATRKGLETAVWENNTHGYQSYRGVPQLRNGIASWYKRFYQVEVNYENEVLPLIGSKEGIMHISMSFLEPGDEALVPNPGYPAYRTASMLAGAKVVNYNLKEELGWMPDLKELEQQDLSKVKIMWVNFPNMPTGATANLDFYKRLIAFAKRNEILIVNDNPYSFILQDQPMSLLSIEGAKDVAMELNSLSKSHNMAGWRVGMLIGKKEWIDIVLKFKSNMDSGMFLPLQIGAVEALNNPPKWFSDLNEIYRERQEVVFKILEKLNCTFKKEQGGMFVWAKIPSNYNDGYALSDKILYERNVFLTPGGIFGSQGNKFIRISLCNKIEVLEKSLERIN
ncbi:MAG: aminotransferase class I/II-fold pyridoxal phosphate-dependent enzyme [Saprospiraceae bacterium]|nr:aminotransferase class I/II-fold pyridoxal phosphate-dependent enzyme [Saprospiraceae bacterium]MDG2419791.1 aminotransferase class I/II-fold pyridoxal phosphate-dependent enzyme [Saprospiraceae bacterium]